MTTHKEALTLALEALENEKGANNPLDWHHDKAITAIEEALAQPDQAPIQLTLPEPIYTKGDCPSFGEVSQDCYSAEQMRNYARAFASGIKERA